MHVYIDETFEKINFYMEHYMGKTLIRTHDSTFDAIVTRDTGTKYLGLIIIT